jgi:hypothetical protein
VRWNAHAEFEKRLDPLPMIATIIRDVHEIKRAADERAVLHDIFLISRYVKFRRRGSVKRANDPECDFHVTRT